MSDEILRWGLFAAFAAAVPIYGFMVGVVIGGRSWPWRLVLTGGFILLLYLTFGQIKARIYDVPVDEVSAVGIVGVLVLIAGMVLVLARERRTHGQG